MTSIDELDKAFKNLAVIIPQISYISRYEGERDYWLTTLKVVFNKDDINRLAKLVKSEHNTYGIEREMERFEIIYQLALKGYSFSKICDWVERQQEGKVLFLLEYGIKI